MEALLIPDYYDLFGKEKPDLQKLIEDIPSRVIITLMSYINNQLLHYQNEEDCQLKIFAFISARFDKHEFSKLSSRLSIFFAKNNSRFLLFGYRYTIEFISRELENYRDFPFIDTTPEHELNLFKAYLLIVYQLNTKDSILFSKQSEAEGDIREIVWPHAIKNFEFIYPITNPINEGIKSLAFLEFCQKDEKLSPYITDLLKRVNCSTTKEYLSKVLQLVNFSLDQKALSKLNNSNVFTLYENDSVLDSITLLPEAIAEYKQHSKDYLGIKDKPIFRYGNTNVIIHWRYLYNKLFSGFVISLSRNSALSTFKDFGDYKSHISTRFSHKILFKGIMQHAFKSADCIWFDESDQGKKDSFNPDCYVRLGKTIYIIEFKDYLVNKDVIQSENYEKIKNEIDNKFLKSNDGNKGVTQLIRNLKNLSDNPPAFDKYFSTSKNKIRNCKVYPIIVHTNFYFSIPGLNEYVNEKFWQEASKLKNTFKPLKSITVINIDFFLEKLNHFNQEIIHLDSLIDDYNYQLRRFVSNRKGDLFSRMWGSIASFDEIMMRKTFPEVDYSNYTIDLYRCLNIDPSKY